MTKKVLSAIICVCLMFSMFSCFASAAAIPFIEDEIPVKVRVCPDTVLDVTAPTVTGNVYSEGWEIKVIGGDWIPYDGEPLDARTYDGASVRYFAANAVGGYAYSNEAELVLAHNPIGSYKYDDNYHWRDCSDCDGQASMEKHTTLGEDATSKDNICKVCGQIRSSSLSGFLVFWEWLMALITSLIG